MASMTAPQPKLTPTMKFMITCAGAKPQTSKAKADGKLIERVRGLVNIIGINPDTDYGGDKKVLDKTAVAHASNLSAAVINLADLLLEFASGDDSNTQMALVSSGFVGYFAKYYCDAMKLDYKRSDDTNYANQCNSQVIAPNLTKMLNNTKTS